MNASQTLGELELQCPDCGADVRKSARLIECERGHLIGRLENGVLDFRRQREGVDAELVKFWSSSDDYYETARSVNVDFEDASHAGHRTAMRALVEHRVERVLDIGCGSGEFAVALAAKLPELRYVGIDVSTAAVRAADHLRRPGAYAAMDAERLLFAGATFDAVISLYALEHFSHPRQTIEEMARVLRPGGILALLSISYDRPWGTIPSIRLGAVRKGRKLARWHPLNVATYASNRMRFGSRQLGKHLRYAIDPSYTDFELVERPLVLEGAYLADLDAVHVVSGRSVLRLLERLELMIIDSTVVDSPWRGFIIPFELRIVARKRGGGV
jgi:2-polyprenyl-3-methyl-5-hydroxy-6-metoxy-1,4-benzoquinol methylase